MGELGHESSCAWLEGSWQRRIYDKYHTETVSQCYGLYQSVYLSWSLW